MPRSDKTFSDKDLLRFYCNNLEPDEKYRVLVAFNDYIVKGQTICPDDPAEPTNVCEWLDTANRVFSAVSLLADSAQYVLASLVALEATLSVLSWGGPIGRLLIAFRAFVAYLITVVAYVAALSTLISKLALLMDYLNLLLCSGDKPPPLPPPPSIDLPDPPERPMDFIANEINAAIQSAKDFFTGMFDWF